MTAPRAKDEEFGGGCCLLSLSALGLLLVLPFMIGMAWRNSQSLVNSVDTTDVQAFLRSIWDWLRTGPRADKSLKVFWLFSVGYCFLFTQWLAFVWQWRTVVSSRRLWIISSVYFGAMIVSLSWLCWEEVGSWEAWLTATVLLSIIPGFLLFITLRLWKWSRSPDK
jgi:hypothetical protein